jgi:hypothetical protein
VDIVVQLSECHPCIAFIGESLGSMYCVVLHGDELTWRLSDEHCAPGNIRVMGFFGDF